MHPRQTILSLTAALLAAATLLAACAGPSATITQPTAPAAGSRDAAQLFDAACASCHGPLGEGGLSGVSLKGTMAGDRQKVIDAIRHGAGGMPALSGGMSDEQINAIADYVASLR